MSRSTLSFDAEALDRLAATLAGVQSAFDATGSAGIAPEHVGHARLAQRVESFSSSWNDTRRSLAEEIGGLSSSARSIADGFRAADDSLAAALTGDEGTS
jgi:hypothetical protein